MDKIKTRFWIQQLYGTLLFFAGIAASYFGALQNIPWFGIVVVALIIVLDLLKNKQLALQKIKLVIAVSIAAVLIETMLISTSVYSVTPNSRLLDLKFVVPIWIMALWLNFIIRVPSYLIFTRGRHFINALLGVVFALLIFRSGNRMGLIDLHYGVYSSVIIAIAWGAFVPSIYMLANRIFPIHKK